MAEREYSVKITADASGFKAAFQAANGLVSEFTAGLKEGMAQGAAELRKGSDGVKQFGEQAQKAAGALSSWDSIALKISGIVGALDLAGKAMAGIGSSIEAVFAGINRGAQFNDLSQRLGVSVESLSRLELAAKTSGVSLDGLGVGLQQLSKNIVAAAGGSQEAAAAFASLGISAADLKSLNTEQVLGKIAQSFSGAEDGASKTAVAMAILGRSGAEMIPLLNGGAAELQKFSDLSEKLGLTMTTQLASAFDSIGDSMDVLGSVATGVQNQLAIGMAPALEAISTAAVELVSNLGIANGGISDFGASIGTAIVNGADAALGALNTFVETVYSFGLGDALLQVFGAAFLQLEQLAEAQGRVIGLKFVQAFGSAVDSLIGSIPGLMLLDKPFTNLAQGSIDEASQQVRDLAASFTSLGQGSPQLAQLSSAIEGARGKLQQFTTAIGQNADGSLIYAGAVDQAADSTRKGTIAYQGHGDAAKKAADAVEKLRERFAEQIKTQTEAVDKMEGQNAALQKIIDGNLSAADAQALLNEATGEAAVQAALHTGATQDEADQLGVLAQRLAEATQHSRELNAIRNAQTQNNALQLELSLTEQVNQGLITKLDKEIAIARARADGNVRLADEYEKQIRLKDAIADQEAQYVHLGDTIKGTFSQVFDALIAGTLDLGDSLKSLGLGIGKQFFNSMLESKFKDFDPTVKGNFLDLGEFGKSIFGDLFSGGSGVSGDSSGGGGLFKQAADWIGGLFKGASDSGSFGSGYGYTGFDGEGGYSGDASLDGGGYGGGGGGFSWGGALAGAGAGYASSGFFGDQWINDTGLPESLRLVQDQALNRLRGINQVVSTILGAVFGGLAGGGGVGGGIIGTIFGAFDSLVGSAWGDRIDRSVLRDRGFGGSTGKFGPAFLGSGGANWDLIGSIDPLANLVMTTLLGLPTLGTAFRRAGEGVLDQSKIFGEKDGGLQELLGDFVRDKGLGLDDNYRTGGATALSRGLSQDQVDALVGSGSSIFSQIFSGEKFPEDAGRLAAEMGQGMAEFLSRGLAEGMDFDAMLTAMRGFAQEAGITLNSSIKGLGPLFEQTKAAAMEFGHLDAFTADEQAAKAYAQGLYGITKIFGVDMPAGVNLASIALRYFTKDGENAFGVMDKTALDTLQNLTTDAQSYQDVVAELVSQGYQIDADAMTQDLQAIVESAQFVGQNIGALFSSEDVTQGIDAMASTLRDQINAVVQDVAIGQLFDGTRIAESFAPVFDLLNRAKSGEFNFLNGADSGLFNQEMLDAIAQGKANLAEWIPQIQAARAAMLEVQEAIDEALAPDPVQQFWENFAAASDSFTANFQGAVGDAFAAGIAEVRKTGDIQAGIDAFSEALSTSVENSVIQGITSAVVQGAVISANIGPMMAQLQAETAAAMQDGVIDASEQAKLEGLAANIVDAGQTAIDQLKPLFEALGNIVLHVDTSELDDAVNGGGGGGREFPGGDNNGASDTSSASFYADTQGRTGGPTFNPPSGPRGPINNPTDPGNGRPPRPHVPPPPAPGGGGGGGDGTTTDVELNVSFNFDGALDDFFNGGTVGDLETALRKAAGEGIMKGMMDAMLAEAGMEEFKSKIAKAIHDAMADGTITPEELADIEGMGQDFADKLRDMAEALGPAFKDIAEAFGLDLTEETDPLAESLAAQYGDQFKNIADQFGLELSGDIGAALAKAGKTGADLIGSSLRGLLSDPSKLNYATFAAGLREAIYNNVAQGLIDAFIQTAVIQGALAVPLGIIQAAFAAVAAGQMNAAEANAAIAEQIALILKLINGPDFQSMIDGLLDAIRSIAQGLGISTDALGGAASGVSGAADSFNDAAAAAGDACAGECDLQQKLQKTEDKITTLDKGGQQGLVHDEYYGPRGPDGTTGSDKSPWEDFQQRQQWGNSVTLLIDEFRNGAKDVHTFFEELQGLFDEFAATFGGDANPFFGRDNLWIPNQDGHYTPTEMPDILNKLLVPWLNNMGIWWKDWTPTPDDLPPWVGPHPPPGSGGWTNPGWGSGVPPEIWQFLKEHPEFLSQFLRMPGMPGMPHLAEGGVVTRPTVALFGEAGPEAVIPLNRLFTSSRSSDREEQSESIREELREAARVNKEMLDEIRSLRQESKRNDENVPLRAEIKINDEVLIDAWTTARRTAERAGIPF